MTRIVTILAVAAACSPAAAGLAVQWNVARGGNGHYYEVIAVPAGITWDDAHAAVRGTGGYLVTITSAEENAFVFGLIDDHAYWTWVFPYTQSVPVYLGPWIGGRQPAGASEPGGGWEWITGEPFSYSNWSPGNPDNSFAAFGNQNRLHFGYQLAQTPGPTWNDMQGDYGDLVGYVVEWVPEPTPISLFSLAGLALLRRKR